MKFPPQRRRSGVSLGRVRVVRAGRKLWLIHTDGEAMECGPDTERRLAALVQRFFARFF